MNSQVESYLTHARNLFESWADIDADQFPDNPVDALQVRLMRWQRRNFDDVSPASKLDVHMTLGVVEEFGELFDAKVLYGKHGKLDALGDVCVYAGQLCIGNRLALRPLINFAEEMVEQWQEERARDDIPDPTVVAGQLCHAALKRDQKIRGYDSDDKWRLELALRLVPILAWAKLDTVLLDTEPPDDKPDEEPGSPEHLEWRDLIHRTYLDVGHRVVLKRDWTKDRLAGQTPK